MPSTSRPFPKGKSSLRLGRKQKVPRTRAPLPFELVGAIKFAPTHQAKLSTGVRLVTTVRTISNLTGNLSVDPAIPPVYFENSSLEIFLGEISSFSNELPHGLAGKGKPIEMTSNLIHFCIDSLGFVLRISCQSAGLMNLCLLMNFPNHNVLN